MSYSLVLHKYYIVDGVEVHREHFDIAFFSDVIDADNAAIQLLKTFENQSDSRCFYDIHVLVS